MSRFEEVVNEAIGEVVLSESPFRAETLAQHIAELVRERQGAERAEVTIAARYPEHKPAPVSGVQTQEIYTLHGRAVAFEHGTRRMVGVSATGMTACPCAQELVAARARERLPARTSRAEQIERDPRAACPVATHNQRGLATLQIGCIEDCDRRDRRRDAAGDRRGEHVLGDLRADEALRRGRGRGKGPPPSALRRGLRARDDRRRGRRLPASSTARASSRPARRTSRRSTSTTSSPSATACSRSCARRSTRARPCAHQTSLEEWLDAGAPGAARRRPAAARGALAPAACAGAGRRSSPGPRATVTTTVA